jgi:adenylate kinase family enzyme
MRRVSVVGNAGSGKTALARRLAEVLGVPHVELDAIHHLPGWQPIDPAAFELAVREVAAGDGWVVDGNYRVAVMDGPVWRRADTVVWLDLPRRTVMRQVIMRTVRRLVRREVLWNGNREPLRNVLSFDPQRSIIRWAWTQHEKYRQRYGAAMASPALAHLDVVRLRSHAQAEAWLADLSQRPVGRRE